MKSIREMMAMIADNTEITDDSNVTEAQLEAAFSADYLKNEHPKRVADERA